MPRKTWKPSLEEGAVLCLIRTKREAAFRAPLVAQVLARWINEWNKPALKAAQQALKTDIGQDALRPGRPPKVRNYTPKDIAARRELLVLFLENLLRPVERKQLPQLRPSTAKVAQEEDTPPQSPERTADALFQGLFGIGKSTLKHTLAKGKKELLRPRGLADLARDAGIQPESWKPLWDYLLSLPWPDRLHVLSQLLPPHTPSTT